MLLHKGYFEVVELFTYIRQVNIKQETEFSGNFEDRFKLLNMLICFSA